jgi:hypothetical protein
MSPDRDHGPEPTRKERRAQAREARRAEEDARRRAAASRRRLLLIGGALAIAFASAGVALVLSGGSAATGSATSRMPRFGLAPLASLGPLHPPAPAGPRGSEEVPVPDAPRLATTATKTSGQPVDGIGCSAGEQTLFHIHAHLTVFVDGAARQIPYGIGILNAETFPTPRGPFVEAGSCFYWLHTHAPDGIIHIESPVERIYTLGEFFDEWGQPLGPTRVGPAKGPVTAIYNGRRFEANPREIPLTRHAQIQLEIGRPLVAPETIEFPNGL